jgi:hypothetical protein
VVIDPSQLLLHNGLFTSGVLNTMGVVVVNEMFCTALQPAASVTSTEYEPAHKPLILGVLAEFDHWVLYAGVPPLIVRLMFPSQTPEQLMSFFVKVITGPLTELIEYTLV